MQLTHDTFLKQFCSNDTVFRISLCKPALIEDLVYATDAHSLIRISKEVLLENYLENEKFPNAKKVIDDTIRLENPLCIEVEKSKSIFDKIKVYPLFEECEDCDGSGTCYCDCCDNYYKCKSCNGEGVSNSIQGYGYDTMKDRIKIGNGYFHPKYVRRLFEAAELEKENKITILSNSGNCAMICKVGRIEILLMPILTESDDAYNIHTIEITEFIG